MFTELVSKLDNDYTLMQTKEMVAIPSIVGNEADLAEYIRNELESLGLKTMVQVVEQGRPNVYGKLKGTGDGKKLNFNGHTDTVPVTEGWETDPFKPVIREGRLYGLGSCDMKSGIACTLTMLKAFVESDFIFDGELSFSGVIDEEAYGKGAKAMLQTEYGKVDAIILAEPYPGDETKPIPYGITGKILYDIYVKGKAAHGFRPQLGVNAIEDASKIISNLEKLNFKENENFGKGNYCTLKIKGGYEIYSVIIPERTRFEVNRLLVPGETIEYAVNDMKRLIDELNLNSSVDVKIKPPQYESYEMAEDHQLFKVFEPIYREVMGEPPVYEYAYGITDANIFAGVGDIPCLHLGPQRGGAHQKNEYVPISWLKPISEMYTKIAASYLR